MPNRRELLWTAALAGALSHGLPSLATERPRSGLYKVIFDEAYPESLTFAAEARSLGGRAEPLKGEVTRLWYEDLHPRWTSQPLAVAGLTDELTLFGLDLMARDVGLRVVHRVEHPLQDQLRATGAAQDDWARQAARGVMAHPLAGARPAPATLGPAFARPGARSRVLVSWIIAPVAKTV